MSASAASPASARVIKPGTGLQVPGQIKPAALLQETEEAQSAPTRSCHNPRFFSLIKTFHPARLARWRTISPFPH